MADSHIPEADRIEQHQEADGSDPDARSPADRVLPVEASEADVVEQSEEVPVDDDDERR